MATKIKIETKADLLAFIEQPNIKMLINKDGDEVRVYNRAEEGCDDKYLFSFSPSEVGVEPKKDFYDGKIARKIKDENEYLNICTSKGCSHCKNKSKKKKKKCKKCKKVIKDIDFNLKPFVNNFGSPQQMLGWVVSALQNDHPDIRASPEPLSSGVSIYYSKNWRDNEENDYKYLFNLKEVNGKPVITVVDVSHKEL